ncbi:PRC-barrel domain containing protein [Mesobaculum littorinae]|uniref:PRC-barrel domain containing protein n=1 Tax=Mesobaculum littorinae TaxID=2486419 RepID=A0A438AL27_9RHOB|nr:PRC-barrel domain-containing protein [Mesobaculum littorinae]RVV99382.1 PRC-barrel domain containing protein [Mesobaculum littorinae]
MKILNASALALTIAALPALPAAAQMAQTADEMDLGSYVSADQLSDGTIYAIDADDGAWGENELYSEVGTDWENAGSIEDIVLDQKGQIVGVIAEVGGFLGIGDKEVMLPLDALRLVQDGDEYAYVTNYTVDQLNDLQDVEDTWYDD